MASNQSQAGASAPGPEDLPPPYSAVVGNPQYGFVMQPADGMYPPPAGYSQESMVKSYTAPGVYPHPPVAMVTQPLPSALPPQPPGPAGPGQPHPIAILLPECGREPFTVTCYSCSKVVTTKVKHNTAWHTHLVAGSICVITMPCSLCCLGVIPYFFDSFKDVEHFCPNCNTFIGKSNKC